MEKLILIKPSKEYEKQAKEYIQEFKDNSSQIHGTGGLDKNLDNYDSWLRQVEDYSVGVNLKEGHVPADTFFAISENTNILVGMIDIRHRLNDLLLSHGGHVGYGVRPSERKKGYATKMLYLAIEKCKELGIDNALVTCDIKNIGSAKTIQNNFGKLENEIEADGITYQRYWINVGELLNMKKQTGAN